MSLFAMLFMARAHGASESSPMPAALQESTAVAVAPSSWWLSAGVFRTDGAAEARRAALVAHGVTDVRVIDAPLAGSVLHRVVVGPFADRARARSQLPTVRGVAADAFALTIAHTADTADVTTTSAVVPPSAMHVEPSVTPAPPIAPQAAATNSSTTSSTTSLTTSSNTKDEVLLEPPIERTRGISLQEYLRRNGGNTPTSPSVAPQGYQLNQLHRAGSPNSPTRSSAEIHDVTPDASPPRDQQPGIARRTMDSVQVECVMARWWHWLVDAIF